MRRLIWIPILHTAADLGSAAVEAERLHGKQQWQALQQQLTLAWNELTGRLQAMHLNYARVRIYQDGLPIAGDAGRAAVAELAAVAAITTPCCSYWCRREPFWRQRTPPACCCRNSPCCASMPGRGEKSRPGGC